MCLFNIICIVYISIFLLTSLSAPASECEMIWLHFLLNVLGFFIVYYFHSSNGLLAFFYFWQNGELMTLHSDNTKWKYQRFDSIRFGSVRFGSVRLILFIIIMIPMHIANTCATTFSWFHNHLLFLFHSSSSSNYYDDDYYYDSNAISFLLFLWLNFPP